MCLWKNAVAKREAYMMNIGIRTKLAVIINDAIAIFHYYQLNRNHISYYYHC
jgi:hypothetical protein